MIHVYGGSNIDCYTDFSLQAIFYFLGKWYILLDVLSVIRQMKFYYTFWDCPKTRNFWLHVQSWIHTNFTHCDNLTFTKEFIIFGSKINVASDRILDLFILMAKHHIFTARVQGTIPHLNTLIMKMKSRFLEEKYYYTVNNLSSMFTSKWVLYLSEFS